MSSLERVGEPPRPGRSRACSEAIAREKDLGIRGFYESYNMCCGDVMCVGHLGYDCPNRDGRKPNRDGKKTIDQGRLAQLLSE